MSQIAAELESVLLADAGILEAFGMHVASALGGRCELVCQVPGSLVNAGGFAHGSIAFALLDTACAYALKSLGVSGVTSNANVSYIKGGTAGCEMRGVVTVLSQTRRVATLRGEVHIIEGDQRALAAHGSFVFQLRVPKS